MAASSLAKCATLSLDCMVDCPLSTMNLGIVACYVKCNVAHLGYKVDLGSKISEYSPFTLWLTSGTKIHSKTKMDIFYLMLVAALLIVAACLGFGIRHQTVLAPAPTAAVVAPPPG